MYPSLALYLSDNLHNSSADPNSDDLEYSSFDEEEVEIIGRLLESHKKFEHPFSRHVTVETIVEEIIATQENSNADESENGFCEVPSLPTQSIQTAASITTQYQELCRHTHEDIEELPKQTDVIETPAKDDSHRAPFNRFRGERRGLSVTDLVSNVWCEKQFEFYLVKGKKRTTPEMTKGKKIHAKLEEEVHEIVPVKVMTKEDTWGVKLINIIQGLKELKENGLTRELPVFAFVNGYFIRGIIDEISYTKPEQHTIGIETMSAPKASPSGDEAKKEKPPLKKRGRKRKENMPPATTEKMAIYPEDVEAEPSITDFAVTLSKEPINPNVPQLLKTAYISDCKTRASNTLPTPSQYRASELQLMLYHLLLTSMYSRTNDDNTCLNTIQKIATTQNLNPDQAFSDVFIAEIAPLFPEIDSSTSLSTVSEFPNFTELLSHNSLNGLSKLVQRCFSIAIPQLSNTLAVSYRSQANGSIIATKTFEHDPKSLDDHLDNVMRWWKGEREALGVTVEEAWKCYRCEFAEECEWRLGKIVELKNEQLRKKDEKGKKRKS